MKRLQLLFALKVNLSQEHVAKYSGSSAFGQYRVICGSLLTLVIGMAKNAHDVLDWNA